MKKIVPQNAILIPDNAERVFSGQIFDVYQWPQQMFDGSTQTFEMLKRSDTVQILAIKDGKIVLVNDEQPNRKGAYLHLPGGRVDPDDLDWLRAAKREMREETGLTFKNWRLIHVEQPLQKAEWFYSLFLAIGLEGEESQKLDSGGERIEVMYQTFEDLRMKVLQGKEPALNFAIPFFQSVKTFESILVLPEFVGLEVDR